MKIDLSSDEAQVLLDGVNAVLKEKQKDIAWFSAVLTVPGPGRDHVLDQLRGEAIIARSARDKIARAAP